LIFWFCPAFDTISRMPESARIQVLPDTVINQIAAGEVVERPASVLKELVENCIDAGATQIDVDVVDGGRRLVRVRDNGVGMDRDNALLSIERHATSKLRELKDLDSIRTMGFRGEALAAIASVSQFTLATQQAGAHAGTEILIFGGKIQEVRDAGGPVGTEISVRNLFFNVPARRKFMRTAQTEFTHVRQAFMLEALANVGVGWTLRADDEDVYRLPPADNLLDRIRDLYGEEVARHLRPLRSGNGVVEIGGYAGLPPFSRLDREAQVVFVNGRPSGSPIVNFAIQNAYRSALPGGRYAPIFLHVDLPPDMVDVNVHPAKKEVRFRRPTEVRDVIVEAIRLAISGPELPHGKLPERAPRDAKTGCPPTAADAPPRPLSASAPDAPAPPPPPPQAVPVPVAVSQPKLDWTPPPVPAEAPSAQPSAPWGEYRLMGRVGGLYVVLETADGLVLMDSRSAHERVVYERLMGGIDRTAVPSQGLLPPVAVQVAPSQANALRKHAAVLRQMGFGVSEFGADTFMVDALPIWLAELDPGPLLSDVADHLAQGGKGNAKDWARPIVAAAAGRQSVALQRELNSAELHALIQDLARTEMPYTSPRGKPTVILLSFRELNRKFGRE
jgi:DNA mismatch repair protein MutL